MPLKNYSSGMVARIAFAIATVTEPDVLIVDETLSVGDVFFQEKCEARIKSFIDSGHVTVLFVSHSIEQVERICTRAVWIEKGQQRMDGPVEEVCRAYRAQFDCSAGGGEGRFSPGASAFRCPPQSFPCRSISSLPPVSARRTVLQEPLSGTVRPAR